ncbi:major facilitator superfamily domain-containing protein [Hypoxylon crocopeplum]|nr:major facilitator superfamily domain-containing protein [Hypoxylon crocopeplum]
MQTGQEEGVAVADERTMSEKPPASEAGPESEKQLFQGSPDNANAPSVENTPKEDNIHYVTGAKLVVIVISLVLASFLMLLDTSIVSTAVPAISDEFHSLEDVGWYAAAYNLGSAALQPLTGKIYNCFRLKWSFLTFFLVFEIGSVLCGAAQSSSMLIIGRAIAGAGASGLLSGSIIIVSSSVPLSRRPPLIGLIQGIAQLGTVIAPLIGGAFTSGYTWRWSFYINLPFGAIVAIPILFLRIPEQIKKQPALKILPKLHQHLDLVGFALLAPAVIQLLLALQFGGNQFAWNSSQVIGLFVGSGATLIVWIFWNSYKGDDGLLPFSMMKRRIVWASALNYSFQMETLFGTSYWLPIYFQAVKGVSAILSGVYLLPTILAQLIFTVLAGILVPKVGYIPPFSIFAGVLISIGCGLFTLLQPDTSTGKWIGYQIIASSGRGAGLQMPIVAVQNSVSQQDLSTAMAFLLWAQYIGPTIFLTLYNTIFSTSLRTLLPQQAPNVDAQAVLAAGATRFRDVVDPQYLPSVLIAYSKSIDRVFYLAAGAGVGGFIAAWGMGWQDIRKKSGSAPGQPPVAEV